MNQLEKVNDAGCYLYYIETDKAATPTFRFTQLGGLVEYHKLTVEKLSEILENFDDIEYTTVGR